MDDLDEILELFRAPALTPYYESEHARLYNGDSLEVLKSLRPESVHCCVTSPPYFGLRTYGTETWDGGDDDCEHSVGNQVADSKADRAIANGVRPGADTSKCRKCGAIRVDKQIGLEQTPEEYVANLVAIFREVKRVLRSDGVLFLNLGDSYVGSNQTGGTKSKEGSHGRSSRMFKSASSMTTLAPKNLYGIPWRVTFALQEDGWILRSDIVWSKGNAMPESISDRPTRSHEYIFLLAKSQRYYYDIESVKEPVAETNAQRTTAKYNTAEKYGAGNGGNSGLDSLAARMRAGEHNMRRQRSVWTTVADPFDPKTVGITDVDHFAAYPPALIRPCVLAGTSEHGVCARCGAPWKRVVEKGEPELACWSKKGARAYDLDAAAMVDKSLESGSTLKHVVPTQTIGWQPTCKCGTDEVVPATILDPFNGTATTGVVALENGRDYIGIDLSADYCRLSAARLKQCEQSKSLSLF